MSVAEALKLPAAVHQHLSDDAAPGADALADFIAEQLRIALAARAKASLLVSGGRSPLAFFASLSQRELDWPRVTISLADERCVPGDDDASNARLVREHLLRGRAATARFVALYVDGLAPEAAAREAEARLATIATPFDAVVLGMGDDGHTASLFADADGSAAGLDPQQSRRVLATYPRSAPHARLSLSLRALLDSRLLALAISGERKRQVIEAAVDAAPARLPIAALLQQTQVPLHLFFNA
ncbi:6-phosphogluconolactonase [Solimonas terrae]|uniref:6-phosphogluconolactonase n=1 Tax=Solimonas terrae TaxID=1396819 RepID=A0A6M2BPZ4_9GAMM|nr:6-phosphogluconolactonase [Solimonas terrae]